MTLYGVMVILMHFYTEFVSF